MEKGWFFMIKLGELLQQLTPTITKLHLLLDDYLIVVIMVIVGEYLGEHQCSSQYVVMGGISVLQEPSLTLQILFVVTK